MDSEAIDKFRELLVRQRSRQFSFLSSMIGIASPVGDTDAIATFLTDYLTEAGFEVDVMRSPAAEPGEAEDTDADESVDALIVRHEFGPGPTLVLAASADTAPIGDGWTYDPLGGRVENGIVYGRGAIAAKSDIAAYLYALLALRDSGAPLAGAIELHITFDGEAGGKTTARLVAEGDRRADFAIATGFTHSLITAANGYLQIEVTVTGRGAPASLPGQGSDSLEATARIMSAIYAHRGDLQGMRSETPGIDVPTIVVTEVNGGDSPRILAARTVMSVDRRLLPEEDPVRVERDLNALVATSVIGLPGVRCKIKQTDRSDPMLPGEATEGLIAAFQGAAGQVLGRDLDVRGIPWDTAGRFYANAGIPTVLYGAGPADPGGAGIGGPDEHLILDDLRAATETIGLAAVAILKPVD